VRVALPGDGEGRAHLHAVGAVGQPVAHLLVAAHAAGHDEPRGVLAQLEFFEQLVAVGQHALEVEAFVVEVVQARGAQVAAGMAGMLDHHGVGQPAFLHPLLQHCGHAARFRQDGNQRDLGKIRGHLGQVQRQARAHHDGLGAALAGLAHQGGVVPHGLHDVHRDQAAALRRVQRGAHFAVQRFQVGAVDEVSVMAPFGLFEQIGVVMAQIDAGNGAHGVLAGDGAGQAMGGYADAHAALDDGQQVASGEGE
jgi:hypothetical protein